MVDSFSNENKVACTGLISVKTGFYEHRRKVPANRDKDQSIESTLFR